MDPEDAGTSTHPLPPQTGSPAALGLTDLLVELTVSLNQGPAPFGSKSSINAQKCRKQS